jgi:ATP-dependent DNA helicase RecG
MDAEQITGLIQALTLFGTEGQGVEAKRAAARLPESVTESMSAFANTPGGGVILLGVDEASGFAVTGVADPAKIQADLASLARDRLTPPLLPAMGVVAIDGLPVVWVEVTELARDQKPCYVTTKGMNRGSFVRVGEGDRRLTAEEVQQMVADRGQPRFDHEVVSEADLADLDPRGLRAVLDRVRTANPRLFSAEDDETVLTMLGVIRPDEGRQLRPTIAGLLALGRYPQQFFPQLCLTFVHYPTTTGESAHTSVRFLDNVRVDGPIPVIVREALAVIQRNMSRRALINASGRQDVWEYPPEALREAIVNALVHRDLSPGSRGTQVQVEMFPDRLRVLNPGGLYGAVDITRLGDEGVSSSRNGLLLKILEDVPVPDGTRTVCENRGSGIRTMRSELVRAGMGPPLFQDRVTSFEVVMPNHTLFDDATVRWLGAVGAELKDSQRTALALMHHGEVLDNARYRAATGTSDSRLATSELQDLVARELVDQVGTRGGARYVLSEFARAIGTTGTPRRVRPNRRRQILDLIRLHGHLSKPEVSAMLNINVKTAEHWLGVLRKEGRIEFTEPGRRTRNARYRLTPQGELFDADS